MPLSSKRIFYCEDDLYNRAVVQRILESAGAAMYFERWGQDQLIPRLMESMPIDLILLDLMLPKGVSGYDIFDEIRKRDELAHVPIAAISSSDPAFEIPKLRAKGFLGFISKPISILWFPKQVAQLLKGDAVWVSGDDPVSGFGR